MMSATEHLVIPRPGIDIHAWRSGATTLPLVVVLHGAGVDHHLFDYQIEPLCASGFQVLALDQRGHGLSHDPNLKLFAIRDLARDAFAAINTITNQPFVLIGQSMGGFVAQYITRCVPNRVYALCIIGSNNIFGPITRIDNYALKLSPKWIGYWPWEDFKIRSAQAASCTGKGQAYTYDAFSYLSPSEFATIWGAVANAITPDLRYRVPIPLFMALGEHDRTGRVRESMMDWRQRQPEASFHLIRDAGHNTNYDNPEVFNTALLGFLDSLNLAL